MFQVLEQRIEYVENEEVLGVLEFVYLDSNRVDIVHTFVKLEHRGKGIAKKLVDYAFDYFKRLNLSVAYSCSYVKQYKEEKDEN